MADSAVSCQVFAARRDALREALTDFQPEVGTVLLSDPRDLLYFGGAICGGVLVVTRDRPPVLLAHRVWARLEPTVDIAVQPLRGRRSIRDALLGPTGRSSEAVGAVTRRMTASLHAQLSEVAAPRTLVDISGPVDAIRMQKSESEIRHIRRAAQMAAQAQRVAADALRNGADDRETEIEVEAWLRRKGHPGTRFGAADDAATVVVLAGADGAIPAYPNTALGGPGLSSAVPAGPRGHVPSGEESIVIDLLGYDAGYFADQTRTISTGRLERNLEDALRVCEHALSEMKQVLCVGSRIEDVYQRGEDVVREAGYAEHYMGFGDTAVRFVGHGIGLSVSEPPFLVAGNTEELVANTVVAVEPKLVFPGLGAVGIEDTFVVRAYGCEQLTLEDETESSGESVAS